MVWASFEAKGSKARIGNVISDVCDWAAYTCFNNIINFAAGNNEGLTLYENLRDAYTLVRIRNYPIGLPAKPGFTPVRFM